MTLRAVGPEYVPLRTFRDDDLLDPGSDPLIALLGALSQSERGGTRGGAAHAAFPGTRLVQGPYGEDPPATPVPTGRVNLLRPPCRCSMIMSGCKCSMKMSVYERTDVDYEGAIKDTSVKRSDGGQGGGG